MLELRFHGRGGQGGVTSAELLALTAIAGGKFAQSFPSFGPERRGAPVKAFARISEAQIRNRTAVTTPNITVVLDPSLLTIVNTSEGLVEGGMQVVNSTHSPKALREEIGLKGKLVVVDANKIAAEEIGRVITNTTMLGALLKATGIVDKELLIEQLKKRFGRIAEGNIKAFNRAFDEAQIDG
ncbi:MAG: 2-oxoacid:acceptor oxidoreductase family protein [Deltaproteobacteria bacterium]|nr:2-oxoacid:acceptor oxidoreductase family protein [Deltaproteobacteria bacterium]MBN2671197.1 2-oxoacid:acceptor oxidoreductase family protein [Deltaproteobacteria bacterium]